MGPTYKHTQYGLLSIIIFLIVGILLSFVTLIIIGEGRIFSAIIIVCVYLLGLGMFYCSTIEITEGQVHFWFGIRFIKKVIDLREIQSAEEVLNPWYYFWGVKAIPGGWLYAIAPGPAVEIKLTNGRVVQVGTNQPQELKKAIDNARLVTN